jgi:predicted transcriptional regulator
MQTITIELPDDLAEKLKAQAATSQTTVSEVLTRALDSTLPRDAESYRRAFEDWMTIKPVPGFNAEDRLSRQEANERR